MPVAGVSTLSQCFPLIWNEFGYETSCIVKIIFLAFCAYVKRKKWNVGMIWVSVLVLI
jgi:hypothetical protein